MIKPTKTITIISITTQQADFSSCFINTTNKTDSLKRCGGKRGDATCSISCSCSQNSCDDLICSSLTSNALHKLIFSLAMSSCLYLSFFFVLCSPRSKQLIQLLSALLPTHHNNHHLFYPAFLFFFSSSSRSSRLFLLPHKLVVIVTLNSALFLCYAYLLPRSDNQFGSVFPQHHTISHTHAHQLHTGFLSPVAILFFHSVFRFKIVQLKGNIKE